ncbi:hypothetical protein NFJ02_19g34100 [Pycnococcus provasolii]
MERARTLVLRAQAVQLTAKHKVPEMVSAPVLAAAAAAAGEEATLAPEAGESTAPTAGKEPPRKLTVVKARRRALEQKLATARRAINAAVEEEKALAIMEERETRATAQLFPELTARRAAQAHTQTQTLPPLTSPVTAIGRMTM